MKKSGIHKTHAILLKKTLMANDDAVLDFFTHEFGRISIFVKKFAKSKKKSAELDFFRLLELMIFQGRTAMSIREVATISIFHEFEKSYTASEIGFQWLSRLKYALPEEKIVPKLFTKVVKFLGHFDIEHLQIYDIFYRIKMLSFMGIFPHFEHHKNENYFNPSHSTFSPIKKFGFIEITEINRNWLIFFHTSTLEELKTKIEELYDVQIKTIEKIVNALEKGH